MAEQGPDEDCLTEAEVVRWIDRRPTEADRRRVASHAATCDLCFTLVTEADRAVTGAAADEPTTLGDGRYALTGVLGRGGMGVVHRARDLTLDRDVAIKVLTRAGPDGGARLLAESKAMARLRHPHVVGVYDVVLAPRGSFVVMEYVRGVTLRAWLAEHRPPWPRIVEMYVRIGEGLAAAHRAGVVHRDFKPDNVLVDGDGRPQITDFGLAAAIVPAIAATDEVGGTPAYMAPEQLAGGPIDARADIFAYTVALWEALHGRRPFAETTVRARFAAAASGAIEPTAAGEVPETLRALLLHGLRPRPEDRPATMEELLARLSAASRAATSRRPWRGVALAGLVAAAAIAGLALVLPRAQPGLQATQRCDERLVAGPSALDPEAWAPIARNLGVDRSLWSRLSAEEIHGELRERATALDRAAHDLCAEVQSGSLPQTVGEAGRTCLLRLRWRLDGALELASGGEVEALAQVSRLAAPGWCAAWAREAVATGLFERPPDPELRARERELASLEVRATLRADAGTREAARRLHARAVQAGEPWSWSATGLVYARQLAAVDVAAAGRAYEAIAAFATAHGDPLHAAAAWLAGASLGVEADDAAQVRRSLQRARESVDRLSAPELRRAPGLEAAIVGVWVAAVEGRPDAAIEALRGAQRLAVVGDPIFDARATRLLAEFAGTEGNAEAAVATYSELLRWQEAQPITPAAAIVETLTEIGWMQLEMADLAAARASLERALAVAGRAAPGSEAALLTTELAVELDLQAGELERASARLVAHRQLLTSPAARLETRTAGPRILMQRERFDEAAALLERVVEDTGALQPGREATGLALVLPLACAHLRAGRPALAFALLSPILAWHERHYPRVRATAGANLVAGEAEAALGQLDAARERFTRAEARVVDPRLRAWARFNLAVVAARSTGMTEALRREAAAAAATLAGFPALNHEQRAIADWLGHATQRADDRGRGAAGAVHRRRR